MKAERDADTVAVEIPMANAHCFDHPSYTKGCSRCVIGLGAVVAALIDGADDAR